MVEDEVPVSIRHCGIGMLGYDNIGAHPGMQDLAVYHHETRIMECVLDPPPAGETQIEKRFPSA
jgi:hypothetical protein